MEFSWFGCWSVFANFVFIFIQSVLRVLVHTRFTPTPAIRSFEQDISLNSRRDCALMPPPSKAGDERPVEALRHGCQYVGVGNRPGAGDRSIRCNRRPVRVRQAWAGLQRHEKKRRGGEDDS